MNRFAETSSGSAKPDATANKHPRRALLQTARWRADRSILRFNWPSEIRFDSRLIALGKDFQVREMTRAG